jgi:hypothetical protein
MHSRKPDSTVADISLPMKPKLPLKPTCKLAAFLFLAAVFVSGCVVNGHGRGHNRYASPVAVQPRVAVATPAPAAFTFSDHHRQSVRNYYSQYPRYPQGKKRKWRGNGRGRGHGRGRGNDYRNDYLPPGLARRDVLPPGIQMQAVHGDLVRQLPPAPHGTRYIYHNDQVLLIDVNTRVVLDFINISAAGY